MKTLNPPAIVVQADADLKHLAAQINEKHQACEQALRASVQHALDAGRLLIEAKKRVGHGNWLPWLKANVSVSARTAQAYLKLAKDWPAVEAKAQRVADLSFRDALSLLGKADAGEETEGEPVPAEVAPLMPPLRNGCRRDARAEADPSSDEPEEAPAGPEVRGVGVFRANEAINYLCLIPRNDPLRAMGLKIVTEWIKAHGIESKQEATEAEEQPQRSALDVIYETLEQAVDLADTIEDLNDLSRLVTSVEANLSRLRGILNNKRKKK
jgi:Protein of unknown function (DUF3102)